MNVIHKRILDLVSRGEILISDHGYDEMAEDNILLRDVIAGVNDSELIEDYPDYFKGPCILLLQYDNKKNPIHVVWGIPKGKNSPAVVVTAYRPDPARWTENFRRRKK